MTRLSFNLFAVAALTLTACESMPDAAETERWKARAAQGANTVVDGTMQTVDKGTKRISDIEGIREITQSPSVKNASDPVSDQNFQDAALSPLEDLNIRRRDIPELLTSFSSPYETIRDNSCRGYKAEIAKFDEVLGPDYDVAELDLNDEMKFQERAKDVSLAGVNTLAGLFIPGRGVIKEASGAGTRERYVRALYQRGVARRSYLKGLAKKCYK